MKTCYSALALVFAGCVVNGKAYGPGSSTTGASSGSPSTSTTSDSPAGSPAEVAPSTAATSQAPPPDGENAKLPGYPTAPVDPWAGVAGDQPKRRSKDAADHWEVRTNDFACTAAHDHCLEPDAWFVVDTEPHAMQKAQAEVYVFGPAEPVGAWNAIMKKHGPDHYIAYRTVPATQQNFVPGVLAVGFKDDHPTSGRNAVEKPWAYGKVATVNVELGYYTIEGREPRLRLSGARVAVLRWEPGSKVEIVGNKRRDELAVRTAEVFLPAP